MNSSKKCRWLHHKATLAKVQNMLLTKGQITAAIISSADIIRKSSISDRSGIWLRLETQAVLFDFSLSLLCRSREICNMHKALIYFLHSHKLLENNYTEKSHTHTHKKRYLGLLAVLVIPSYTQLVIPYQRYLFPLFSFSVEFSHISLLCIRRPQCNAIWSYEGDKVTYSPLIFHCIRYL